MKKIKNLYLLVHPNFFTRANAFKQAAYPMPFELADRSGFFVSKNRELVEKWKELYMFNDNHSALAVVSIIPQKFFDLMLHSDESIEDIIVDDDPRIVQIIKDEVAFLKALQQQWGEDCIIVPNNNPEATAEEIALWTSIKGWAFHQQETDMLVLGEYAELCAHVYSLEIADQLNITKREVLTEYTLSQNEPEIHRMRRDISHVEYEDNFYEGIL